MLARGADIRGGRAAPFRIVGIAGFSPLRGEAIELLAIHGIGHGLGGLAERDGKNPGRQRIERPRMAGFGGIEEAPYPRQSLGRGYAFGFIENDPAMDG